MHQFYILINKGNEADYKMLSILRVIPVSETLICEKMGILELINVAFITISPKKKAK